MKRSHQSTLSFIKKPGLTQEQSQISNHVFKTGDRVLINAFAGTGKTTTCSAVIRNNKTKRILYTVFNKSMQTEANHLAGEQVTVCTTHSLALKYCKSSAPKSSYSPYPLPEDCYQLYSLWAGNNIRLNQSARNLWSEMLDGEVPYPTHQAYYHAFINSPQETAEWLDAAYDLIIVDEAQDTDAGLESILRKVQCPIMLVGDMRQDIYQFRGTVNALESLNSENATRFQLTESFRFGPQVANLANIILEGTELKGLGQTEVQYCSFKEATSGGPCTILCQSNAEVFDLARILQKSIHIVGNVFAELRRLKDLPVENLNRQKQKAAHELNTQLVNTIDLVMSLTSETINIVESKCVPAKKAFYTLSTIHSAKGLEWKSVVVMKNPNMDTSLYYVGITRCKLKLSIVCE